MCAMNPQSRRDRQQKILKRENLKLRKNRAPSPISQGFGVWVNELAKVAIDTNTGWVSR